VAITNGNEYVQYSTSLPFDIAEPLYEAGFRVRFEVRDDGILIIPVPGDERATKDDTRSLAQALVERFTSVPHATTDDTRSNG
jgi:hypothetical protein